MVTTLAPCRAFAAESAGQGLAFRAAFNRGMGEHSSEFAITIASWRRNTGGSHAVRGKRFSLTPIRPTYPTHSEFDFEREE